MNKEKFLENFVKTYIVKNRRERVLYLLQNDGRDGFIDKLNHRIQVFFNPKKLVEIRNVNENSILQRLEITANTKCYVFSHHDFDDEFVEFSIAFQQLYGNGLGFCLVPLEGKGIYIEGEQERGAPDRYIYTLR